MPFVSWLFFKNKKSFIEGVNISNFRKIALLCETLGAFVYLCFFIYLLKNITILMVSQYDFFINSIFFLLVVSSLLYLAIYDLLTFSIPEEFTKNLLIIVAIANLIIGLMRLLSNYLPIGSIFKFLSLGNIDNLLGGIFLALIIWIVIKITKEKGMGEGDVDIMAITGLALGFQNAIVSFLSTLFFGSIISLIYAKLVGKYKNLIIPFVPFILIGFCITLAFGRELYDLFFFVRL